MKAPSLSMAHIPRVLGIGVLGLLVACSRQSPTRDGTRDGTRNGTTPASSAAAETRPGDDGGRRCFSVVAKDNSPSTHAVFTAKQCQGGGVTWSAILRALLRRRGSSSAVEQPTPGWTGDVRTLAWDGGNTRVGIDDEADAALFCADSKDLVDAIEGDVKRLNAQPRELERAMGEANPLELECLPDQDANAELMKGLPPPPPLPPAEARARETSKSRVRAALAAQRTWCWGPGGVQFGGKGGLTLHESGEAITFASGAAANSGRWKLQDDGRIEVNVPSGLHHFDVQDSGRLGFNHSAGREELHACPPPR